MPKKQPDAKNSLLQLFGGTIEYRQWFRDHASNQNKLPNAKTMKDLGLDARVLELIQAQTNEKITAASHGFLTTKIPTLQLVNDLRPAIREYGYSAFQAELAGEVPVVILKSQDDFEFLRLRGFDAGMGLQRMIEKLKAWREFGSFSVLGAGEDWIQLHFDAVPNDIQALARDAHKFCPNDTTVKEIASGLKSKFMHLWWD